MRYVALICAAIVIVAGAVIGTILVTGDDSPTYQGGPSATSRSSTTTPSGSPTRTTKPASTSPAADRFALASAGLRRIAREHTPSTAHPVVQLASCPFARGTSLAGAGLRAAGVAADGARPSSADVKFWADDGDNGTAVTCRFTGSRQFTAAAYTHAQRVAVAPIAGYVGPTAFAGGRSYRSAGKTSCAAYWAPPASDYVISVQFAAPERATAAACDAALRAVQPTIFTRLVEIQTSG